MLTSRLGAAGLVAALALGACGGDDDSQAFCDDLTHVNDDLTALDPGNSDQLDDMVASLQELDPPGEIEQAYNNVTSLYSEIARNDTPLSDPELATDFANLEADVQAIDDYTAEHCEPSDG